MDVKELLKKGISEDLATEIATAFDGYKNEIKAANEKLTQVIFDSAVEKELMSFMPKNIKAVLSLLDLSAVSFKEGKLSGLTEQLKMLLHTDSYLFDNKKQVPSSGNFVRLNDFKNPFEKGSFNLTEQGKLLKRFPEFLKKLR